MSQEIIVETILASNSESTLATKLSTLATNALSFGTSDSGEIAVSKDERFLSIHAHRTFAPNNVKTEIRTGDTTSLVSVREVKQTVKTYSPHAQAIIDHIASVFMPTMNGEVDWSKIDNQALKKCEFSRKDRKLALKLVNQIKAWIKKDKLETTSFSIPAKALRVELADLASVDAHAKELSEDFKGDDDAQTDHAKALKPKKEITRTTTPKVATKLQKLNSDRTRKMAALGELESLAGKDSQVYKTLLRQIATLDVQIAEEKKANVQKMQAARKAKASNDTDVTIATDAK